MAYAPPRYQEIMDEVVDKSQTFYYYNSIVKICAPIYIGTEVFQKHSYLNLRLITLQSDT
jgi:hypothetical protein